jgi:hypothetical protein
MISCKFINSRSRSKYRMLDTDTKKKAINFATNHKEGIFQGLKEASDKFNAPIKSLKRWIKIGHLRKKGGGRKTKDPDMESKLYEWVKT